MSKNKQPQLVSSPASQGATAVAEPPVSLDSAQPVSGVSLDAPEATGEAAPRTLPPPPAVPASEMHTFTLPPKRTAPPINRLAGRIDWQGKPVQANRVLGGSNLTEAEIQVLEEADDVGTILAVGLDPEAIQALKTGGLIEANPLDRKPGNSYRLTHRGLEVRFALQSAKSRRPKEEGQAAPSMIVDGRELKKVNQRVIYWDRGDLNQSGALRPVSAVVTDIHRNGRLNLLVATNRGEMPRTGRDYSPTPKLGCWSFDPAEDEQRKEIAELKERLARLEKALSAK